MNDIKLIPSDEPGFYDWSFVEGDVEDVIGDQQLVSSVRHAILTHDGELEQEVFTDNGCDIYQYLGGSVNSNTLSLIKGEIENSVNMLEGVRESEVELSDDGNGICITRITVTKEKGGTVEIGI